MEIFLIKNIEIKPTNKSLMYKENPKIKGAFVDCIVPANNMDEAKIKAIESLQKDNYEIIFIDSVDDVSKWRWKNKKNKIKYDKLISQAQKYNMLVYSEFYCYENK